MYSSSALCTCTSCFFQHPTITAYRASSALCTCTSCFCNPIAAEQDHVALLLCALVRVASIALRPCFNLYPFCSVHLYELLQNSSRFILLFDDFCSVHLYELLHVNKVPTPKYLFLLLCALVRVASLPPCSIIILLSFCSVHLYELLRARGPAE